MNKYALILLLPAIMMGCSTQKRVPQSAYSTAGTIASAPATPQPSAAVTTPQSASAPATGEVTSRSERVSLADGESNPLQNFNIIVGSFSVYNNALNLKSRLTAQGYNPTLLKNEQGMFRVCIMGFNEEAPARSQVGTIKNRFPEFSDAWLLIVRR
jgi:cell division septation protein DedD